MDNTFCHGCAGRGWVSPSYGIAVLCPLCDGTGVAKEKYRPITPAPKPDSNKVWSGSDASFGPMQFDTPQKAKVGDVVQSKRDGRIQFAVGYVGAEYAFSDPKKRIGSWMLEHGDYVIVRSGAEAAQEQP